MRSSTETIARALRVLAATVNAPDDVPRLALQEAADRLAEQMAALYAALPFVEDSQSAHEYKPGYAKKVAAQVRAAIGEARSNP